jgi:hypothetical protein
LLGDRNANGIYRLQDILPENPLRRIASGVEASRKGQEALAENIAGDQTGAGFIEQSINSGFRSFGQMAPGAAASVMTGNPYFMAGSAGALQGSQSATRALDEGKSPLTALSYGAADATAEVATEMIPVGRLLKDLKAGSPFLKTLAHQAVTEVPTEMAATAWQNLNEWAMLHPDKPVGDYLGALPEAEAQTILATLTTTVLSAGMGHAVHRIANLAGRNQEAAQNAEANTQVLAGMDQLAAASKVRGRDPQSFQQFVDQAAEEGPVQNVYIGAHSLAQSGVAERLVQVSPSVAAQFDEALATGGDVRIPIGEYATHIAGTELNQNLLDHLKTDPNGMSRIEAQDFMASHSEQLQTDIEQAISEREGDAAFKQSADAVRSGIKAQLDTAARFTPQVNDAYASMIGNFYGVTAAKMGTTPEELFRRYPLSIAAENIAGEKTLHQSAKYRASMTQVTIPATNAQARLSPEEDAFYKEMGVETGVQTPELSVPVWKSDHVELGNPRDVTDGHDVFYKPLGNERAIKYDIKNAEGNIVGHAVLEIQDGKPSKLLDIEVKDGEKGKRYGENAVSAIVHDAPGGELGISHIVDGARTWWERLGTKPVDAAHGTLNAVEHGNARASRENKGGLGETLKQGDRGAFDPETNTIALLKNADLSTFLHESGHFFLETTLDIASRSDAPTSVVQDTDALLKWFGVKSLVEWHSLDFEEQRDYHEKFARGFEAYLFEGKAPSIELQGVFQRFRAWLLNVYRDIKNLKVELTEEVRGVFDRMLATNDEIKLAEQGRSMLPLFNSPEQAGMSTDEFAAYHQLGTDATNDAIDSLQARGLRDMQWLHNARGREIKKLQKRSAEMRKQARMDVSREVMSQPVYQAWQFLTSKGEDGAPAGKIRISDVSGDDATWQRLRKLKMISPDGLAADTVAELSGFSSGDELVRALAEATPPKEEIEALTDVRMLEQHGELSSNEAIEREADKAVHNEARARMVATELNALSRAVGKPKVLASAAKEFASTMIARLKVRDIRPGQYANAEARAAKAAAKAIKSGDVSQAAAEKRNQLINTYATRAAYNAQDEIDAGVRYLNKFGTESARKGLSADYTDQIDTLLERFDLRKSTSGRAADERVRLRTWVQSRLNAGELPTISESLLTPTERRKYLAAIESRDEDGNLTYADDETRIGLLADAIDNSEQRSYKDITVEDFRGLVDTVKNIEHLGRLKHKLLTGQDQKTYEEARDTIANGIKENAQGAGRNTRTATDWLGMKLQGIKQFGASHIKVATWARIMDGGKDNGPVWRYLVLPANERASFETSRRAQATLELDKILRPVLSKVSALDKVGKGQFFPGIGDSLNWQERFAIALNTGNESNLQRLLGGRGWSMNQIQPILQTLSAEEWHAVQAVWNHFESYRPEIAAKELRVNGKEPEWIMARPMSVRTSSGETVQLSGGYYPVKFDPRVNLKAQQHVDSEAAKNAMKAAYSAATTQRSFTKERVEEVHGRPLLLNLQGLYSGINDVIHDLAWHEWLIDANRLLRSKTIDEAIREHYGPEVKREFEKWRDDIIAGSKRLDHGIEKAAAWARQGISASGLTFNVMSAAMQPLGFTQTMARLGPAWAGKGLMHYIGDPIAASKEANEKSEWMANRMRTRFRELNELRNQIQGQTHARETMGRYGYWLMMKAQQTVDVPTWWGGYEKAIADGHDERTAVGLADQVVKDSQGGGEEVDQAGIERGGPLVKLFTVFYGFMNTAANLGYLSAKTPRSKARLAADMLLLYSIPAVLGALLRSGLTPGDGGDWDDEEHAIKKIIEAHIDQLFGLIAFGREFSEASKSLLGVGNNMGYSGPAGLRLIPDTVKLAQQAHQGEFDDGFRKSFINTLGDGFGLPAAQANRTITGTRAIADGETQNPAALAFGFQHR